MSDYLSNTILSFTACLENYQETIVLLSGYYQDTIKLSERIVIFIKLANTKKQNNQTKPIWILLKNCCCDRKWLSKEFVMHPPPHRDPRMWVGTFLESWGKSPHVKVLGDLWLKTKSNNIALVLQILAGKKWFYLNHSSVPLKTCLKIPRSHIILDVIMLSGYVILVWPLEKLNFHLASPYL